MNATKELCELTLDDLMKHTWNYTKPEVIGTFDNKIVTGYRFELDKDSKDFFTVVKCNIAEGWIEVFKSTDRSRTLVENIEANDRFYLPESLKDENGKRIIERKNYKGCLLVLDEYGDCIVMLSNLKS